MEVSGLTNEVLHLLLVQNDLPIMGLHEQLIERLGSISPSNSSATCTRNADASASAAERLHPNCQEPSGSDIHEEPRDPTPEDKLPADITAKQNCNNQDDVQDGGHNEAPPANPALNPAHLAMPSIKS